MEGKEGEIWSDGGYFIWITKREGRDLDGRGLKGKHKQVLLRI